MTPSDPILNKWSAELDLATLNSSALVVALFSIPDRRLLFGNLAARQLLKGEAESLVNPSFDKLVGQGVGDPVFEGLLTIGDSISMNTTIEARVCIREEEILITGAVNLQKIMEQNTRMARLNQEISNLQRMLVKEKIMVENTMEDLKDANAQLEVLNQEKNRFLSIAAHDLRNPISTAISFTDILLNNADVFPEDRRQKYLKVIEERLQFSLKLMAELLDVSRIESGSLQLQTSLNDYRELLEQTIQFNQLVGKWKNISIGLECGEGEMVFSFDLSKMEQVLNNLISNAIKYSQPGTEVSVSVQFANGMVETAVRDQGVGIPESELGQIFEPFKKSSSRPTAGESSTGLGLAIAKKIVEEHGGHIGVESKPGAGSTFTFSLPLATGQ
jgi:signal transduction histidine kinase